MWVGVTRRRLTVSGPTRVRNTYSTTYILIATEFTKIVDFSFRLVDIQVAIVINQSYTCAIVTTIFQSAQALYKYGISFLIPDVSYDSTHTLFCRFVVFDSISAAKLQQKSESTNVLHKNLFKKLHKTKIHQDSHLDGLCGAYEIRTRDLLRDRQAF